MLVSENVVSGKIFNTRYPTKGILWFNSKSKKKKIRRISNNPWQSLQFCNISFHSSTIVSFISSLSLTHKDDKLMELSGRGSWMIC